MTLPHRDQLIPELHDAWKECHKAFGDGNVLIVSNSVGTRLDPGLIQAESVTHHLSTPVLRHASLKPSYACISSIRAYFASLPSPIQDDELIVVGDRIFTDVVLANRMSRRRPPSKDAEKSAQEGEAVRQRIGPLSVWTEGIWERESMGFRWLEKQTMQSIRKWITEHNDTVVPQDLGRFVKPFPVPKTLEKPSLVERLWHSLRRS